MSFQTSALILSWVASLLLALVVSGLVRQVHALSTGGAGRPQPIGPRPGSPAPGFDQLAPDRPATTVLLFLDHDCRTCTEVFDEAARTPLRDDLALRALYLDDVPDASSQAPLPTLGRQAELFERYDVVAWPFAVVVDATGHVVRSEPLGSRVALRALLAQVTGSPGAERALDSPSPRGGTP